MGINSGVDGVQVPSLRRDTMATSDEVSCARQSEAYNVAPMTAIRRMRLRPGIANVRSSRHVWGGGGGDSTYQVAKYRTAAPRARRAGDILGAVGRPSTGVLRYSTRICNIFLYKRLPISAISILRGGGGGWVCVGGG